MFFEKRAGANGISVPKCQVLRSKGFGEPAQKDGFDMHHMSCMSCVIRLLYVDLLLKLEKMSGLDKWTTSKCNDMVFLMIL